MVEARQVHSQARYLASVRDSLEITIAWTEITRTHQPHQTPLLAVNPTPQHQRPPAKRVRSMTRSGPSPVRRRRTHRAESRRRVCCHSVGPTLAAVRFAPALPATTQFASVYALEPVALAFTRRRHQSFRMRRIPGPH